jgi:single-stranded-DNA-specific exonuclease
MPNDAELLDLCLKNRGISFEEREKFLNPSYENHIHDPYLLKDMDRAVARIESAITHKEKIIIYSDYDCDGIPAAVIMQDFFKKIGYTDFEVYIPDRHDEGYGLHKDAIKEFAAKGVKLLVTFDLGITAIDEVLYANELGLDVIITDHHLPRQKVNHLGGQARDDLPQAYAIINPKRSDCTYPDKMLCGAGLAFKLVCGLMKSPSITLGAPSLTAGWEKWLLDMASIATLSDQVPLLGENRVLAYYGLKVLQKSRRPGLFEIFHKAGVNLRTLNEEDVTFTLAPRLNAASRMGSPMRAYEVLATDDLAEAKTLSDHLAKINDERKKIVATIMKDVKKTLATRDTSTEEVKQVIVIGNPKWRVGILGLVASKICEEYKKPAFVWGSEGSDTIRGSCRGIGNANLVEVMASLPKDALLSYGGHLNAGGFSVSHEQVHFLEERLLPLFAKNDSSIEIQDSRLIDATITIDDVTANNYQIMEKLSPFGMGNPRPLFKFSKILIAGVKEFGKEKNHLELIFKTSRGGSVKAIAFFKQRGSFSPKPVLGEGDVVDLLATFEKSTFLGKTELRLRIIDIL